MQKQIHSIKINVFEKNQDEIEKINQIYQYLLPLDFKKEKIDIHHEQLDGFNQKIIYSITLETIKKRHNLIILDTIFGNLEKNEIKKIDDQIESRLGDEGDFYIRLDKQSLLDKSFILTEDGNCFHIKIKIAGYPAKRQIFITTIKKILDKYKE